MHRLSLHYSPALIRQAVGGFWWRVVGLRFLLALALVAAGLGWLVLAGDRSWLLGVMASALAMGLAFVVALYVIHYRHSMSRLRAMGEPCATLEATMDALTLASGAGTATLPWSAVTEIWQLRSCWLLLLSRSQFLTLPLGDVTPEAATFILERVRAAGGRVE